MQLNHKTNNFLFICIRYWWLRIGALAEAGEWMELEKFSRTKKPLLGMEVSRSCGL